MRRLFLTLVCCTAFGQQYAFLPVAGSPKSVKTLFQDSVGRLWIGGDQVSCFDGTRFFSLRDYGMPAADTYDFAEDPSGAIWLATGTGVYRYAKGRVEQITHGFAVNVLAATADLAIAVQGPAGKGYPTAGSLVRIQKVGGVWKSESVEDLGGPGPLTLDSARRLLYPWPGRGWVELRLDDVIQWRPGTTLPRVIHPSKSFPSNGPMKVMRDRSGCLWFGATGGNVYDCGAGTHPAPYPRARPESNMHEAHDGTMVLWGDSLLAVGRPGAFHVATPANGLPGLVAALPGRDGTVWLGTTHGLYRLAGGFRSEYWTAREGLPDAPWSVARLGGQIYAGLDGRIVKLTPDRLRWQTIANFDRGLVSALMGTPEGTLWAGFWAGGVVELDAAGRVLAHSVGDGTNASMRLARTTSGETWVGGALLQRVTKSGKLLKYQEHPLATRPSGNLLAIKYEERTRKLWSCYNGGAIVRDERGEWREITTRDGLLTNGCWSLAPLPNGDVWYAYFNLPGMALLRPNGSGGYTIRQFQAKDGTPEPGNDTMDADRAGRLWRAGDLGVYVADPAQAEAGNWLMLDQSDGLPTNSMNSGSVFADTDGSLWWGADNDLAHYTPSADLTTPGAPPQVFISAFSWAGAAPRLAEANDGLPRGRTVVAHIGSLQFDRRNALRLRYRILPDQPAWRESKTLDLPLERLASGTHTLEVQGRLFTGPWSPTASRPLVVAPPLWWTWQFLMTCFLTLMLTAAGAFRVRQKRIEEEEAMLPNLAEWRLGALLPEVHELAGTVLDERFEVGSLLARGGFANVMAGYDRERRQRCAIKVFRGELTGQAGIQQRFEQEVAALDKVRHPNVVRIYAHGVAPSQAPYLVMEFVEGPTLREILDGGPLHAGRAARFLRQLAGALDAIHALAVCHRDVKPENIMVRNQGMACEDAVLIDFSIAIVKDANETFYGLSRAAGSFDYMAPEQAIGYAEPSSDIYSLAKVVIEMLTARQLRQLLPDASLDLSVRVREFAAALPVSLSQESCTALAAALEFDPSRRPRAAGAFASPIIRDLETLSQTLEP